MLGALAQHATDFAARYQMAVADVIELREAQLACDTHRDLRRAREEQSACGVQHLPLSERGECGRRLGAPTPSRPRPAAHARNL